MLRKVVFFVILAIASLPSQGCAGTIKGQGRTLTWRQAAFGTYITLGGTTLLGGYDAGEAQIYSLTNSGVSVKISPITPRNGNWRVTRVKWSNGKTGSSIWIKNRNFYNYTNTTQLMGVSITWENRSLSTTADGQFQEATTDTYTGTYFFMVQHCAKVVHRR